MMFHCERYLFTPSLDDILRDADQTAVHVGGLWGASKSLLAAEAARARGQPLVMLAPSNGEADRIAEDLALFLPAHETLMYPAWGVLPDDIMPPSEEIMSERMAFLQRLVFDSAEKRARAVVVPIRALMHQVPSADSLRRCVLHVRRGDTCDMTELVAAMIELGYERTASVERHGEISVRGGIVDVFPISASLPYRVEFLGDTIETVRIFDPATQRSVEDCDAFSVLPGHEREFMRTLIEANQQAVGLWNHLPDDALVVVDEPERVSEEGRTFENEAHNASLICSYRQAMYGLSKRARGQIHLSSVLSADSSGPSVRVPTRSMTSWAGDTALFWEKLADWADRDYRVVLVCHGTGERDRLTELLAENGYPCDKPDIQQWLNLPLGAVRPGFEVPETRLALLSGCELFGRAYRRRKRVRRTFPEGAPIVAFTDLEPADYVVHIDHGIGRYQGLRRFENKQGEFLAIEYEGGDMLYVPVTRIDTVQKYVGADGSVPALHRLGCSAWERTKTKVSHAVEQMTHELVELYAERISQDGHAFEEDTPWQNEFEDTFEYDETSDQRTAIERTKRDMENPRPMDRLICGDVGFGKTEVALRAAFKAVVDGKQVAMLVPTTVLAQQHFSTFRERVAGFPIRVEMLSRFRTRGQQRRIIESMATGQVDIVIGTHRLLSKDIVFKDVGLLIIDEEQRFGVAQKERLKQMRRTVDVLTLTATPIPRTLQMALMGLRDISTISTPPRDRLSIDTTVCRFSQEVIREAISRELRRGGQVYFIHNRIETIYSIAEMVARLVPEARIAVAHGQLRERELEQIMVDFLDKRTDVLVSTTIVESGLDIPNVNTIVIDRADCYGLADLYQLRGRVGRFKQQAYAYLLVPGEQTISEEALTRLRILEDCSELGSGFQIAMRDLEIRGAGNLLGSEQHGQIAAVGFEMYCELMERAARQFSGQLPTETNIAVADLDVDALIPNEYVSDTGQKVALYKRLAACRTDETVTGLADEIRDRFGPLPSTVSNLLAVMRLRILAGSIGAEHVGRAGNRLTVTFPAGHYPSLDIMKTLNREYGARAEFDMGSVPQIRVRFDNVQHDDIADHALTVLRRAAGAC